MLKNLRAALLALALVILSAASMAAAKPAAPPPPDYFPLKVGDWWKYRFTAKDKAPMEFQVKVVEIEGTGADALYVVETTNPFTVIREWYSKPVGWVLVHRIAYPKNPDMKAEYAPVRKFLQNPLAAGQAWTWEGKGMMDVDIKDAIKVSAAEKVVVPAGTFSGMRVDSQVVQGGAEVEKHYWYANHVGLVKSTTKTGGVESVNELIDYSFKPKR